MTLTLISGANRGIGLELTRHSLGQAHTVIATCRTPSAALAALAQEHPGKLEVVEGLDATNPEAADRLLKQVASRTLDRLILNAGILERNTLDTLDPASLRRQFEVNALAPLCWVARLRATMTRGGKIAFVTSRMGSIADNDSGGSYGYRMSKAALNAAGKSLAVDLASVGIAVTLLHPGWVKTEMTGQTGHVTPAEAAKGLLARIDALSLETTGTFWHMNGEVLPW